MFSLRNFFCILILFINFSCSFNRLFLHPSVAKPDENFIRIGKTRSGDSLVVYFDSISKNPSFYSFKLKDTIEFDFRIESVFFDSRGGKKINGWWLLPKKNKNGLTLLHCHGNAGNMWLQLNAISDLVTSGFQIFMFDYNGFGFSEGKANRKNIYRSGLSALEYVRGHNYFKSQKLILYGQSLGGNLAGVLAGKHINLVDGLVIEGAFSSHKAIARDFVKNIMPLGFIGWLFTKHEYDCKKEIRKFHKPVLVIHSKDDNVIPLRHGKIIFKKANQPKYYLEIEKCHICGPKYYSNEISSKILNMFNSNNAIDY